MDDTQEILERQTAALERIAKDTDTLVLMAQWWIALTVIGAIVWLISAVNGG